MKLPLCDIRLMIGPDQSLMEELCDVVLLSLLIPKVVCSNLEVDYESYEFARIVYAALAVDKEVKTLHYMQLL